MGNEKNYFLIPMDFLEFNFEKLRVEYQKYNKIMWCPPSTQKIKVGDVIYFYVCHIPSNSSKDKSRIMLRGIVKEGPHKTKHDEIYFESQDSNKMILGIAIGELTTLNKEELENDFCYSKEILTSKYNQNHPQGKYWPSTYRNDFNINLIENLEKSFKKTDVRQNLENLINHFNKKCFFSEKIGTKSEHRTFKRRNGTDYYENHHFIQQHAKSTTEDLREIINADANLICLCSNCHNKLHYGEPNEISKMIDILWQDKEIQNMLKQKKFLSKIGVKNENEALKWIKEVYRSNEARIGREADNI